MLGKRLKTLRTTTGLTQSELANIIHVTKTTISYYENDLRMPTLQNLIDLSNYFEVTIDYLLGRDILIKNNITNKNEFVSIEAYKNMCLEK